MGREIEQKLNNGLLAHFRRFVLGSSRDENMHAAYTKAIIFLKMDFVHTFDVSSWAPPAMKKCTPHTPGPLCLAIIGLRAHILNPAIWLGKN